MGVTVSLDLALRMQHSAALLYLRRQGQWLRKWGESSGGCLQGPRADLFHWEYEAVTLGPLLWKDQAGP